MGTSTAMSSGFFNDLRVAKESGWNLTSFITVHDSNTCNLPADKIWEIRKFYDENFTGFCYKMTGINLLFDLEVGANYNDTCSMKTISDDVVEFTGTAESLLQIIDKLNECPGLKYETSIPISDIIPDYVQNSTKRFILDSGCCMRKDLSSYTVQFKKVS